MKTKIQKLITTAIITTLSIVFCNSLLFSNAFATDADNDLSTAHFKLSENLALDEKPEYLKGENPTPIRTFIFKRIIEPAIKIMGTIAVLLVIIGGFVMVTSQGESDQIDKGKDILKYAIIGLVIALFSYIIVISVQSIFLGNEEKPTVTEDGLNGAEDFPTGTNFNNDQIAT